MAVVSRFAPSPTGRLHLGHAVSAVRAHDLARAAGGRFLLRIEDIDPGRAREAHVAGIVEDLAWLELGWDGGMVRQSARLALYAAALERLRDEGLVYPCFCTRRDIAESASAPHGATGGSERAYPRKGGDPVWAPAFAGEQQDEAIYPGTCRARDRGERAVRIAAGAAHAWRIDMAEAVRRTGPLAWHDAIAGWVAADPLAAGDVVVARKDAPVSYHLAVTIDDAAQGVTDVVRGADLFASTHVHRLLQALLGLPTPLYHHHPLVTGAAGRRLAKRDGAPSLAELRGAGADPGAIVAAIRAGARLDSWSGTPR